MVLQEFGPDIWIADGPTVSCYGFPFPTRMAAIKLSDGTSWIWSPTELTDALAAEVETEVGPVRHIVSPNKIHHVFLKQWADRYPEARVYAPPGLEARTCVRDVEFDARLDDEPDPSYGADIDQAVFWGSCFMEEVSFFHKASKTAIVCDLIQRFPAEGQKGWKGLLMRMDGLVGKDRSTPKDLRITFLGGKGRARTAREKVLGWRPEGLVIAHGDCAKDGATEIISRALRWI